VYGGFIRLETKKER